ncbi:TonB-dependent siderophore receptor [Xylophilus sp.]|uniref:TonB-dependent siderophore receptor n=1 Tax=Xylophilus sp. TaxID=2653893 RepID=UPI002D7FF39B|nr:TonB-dependent receptor plug domain-containing protein [Xylophilus sp.]
MSLLITSTVLGTAGLIMPIIAHAQQQSSGQSVQLNIPAQSLRSAINVFTQATGWEVGFTSSAVEGKRSTAVTGTMTPLQGLRTLVTGTGTSVQVSGPTTAALVAASTGNNGAVAADGSTVLDTITVQGENAWGPVDGIVATRSATGTKTDTPIEKIPQTINVVTADEISSRGATSVAQALRYTPGISTSGYTESYMIADETVTRGFSPSSNYLDGAYLPYHGSLGGALQIGPYTLERIEVLKGPASVLYGQNEPRGIINMVSKRPTETPVHEVRVSTGTYGRTEAAVDFGDPVTKDKTLLYRFVGLGNLGDDQIDFTERSRMLFAPSLTWQPTA